MKIRIVRYNTQREVVKVDSFHASTIKLHPAGLMEISGGSIIDTQYVRILATDPLNIVIEDEDANEFKQ